MKRVMNYTVGLGLSALVIVIVASAVPWQTLGLASLLQYLPGGVSFPKAPSNLPWVWENLILLLLLMAAVGATLLALVYKGTKWMALWGAVAVLLWIVTLPTVAVWMDAVDRSTRSTSVTSNVPATTVECPGTVSDPDRPIILGQGWRDIFEPGQVCDFTRAVGKGKIEVAGNNCSYTLDDKGAKVGSCQGAPKQYRCLTTKNCEVFVMLCPPGKGPDDGSWVCRLFEGGSRFARY